MTEINFEPQTVRIATRQHVGASAQPIVSQGQTVQSGQMIGRIPENSLGAAIHASISGTVTQVTEGYIEIRRG